MTEYAHILIHDGYTQHVMFVILSYNAHCINAFEAGGNRKGCSKETEVLPLDVILLHAVTLVCDKKFCASFQNTSDHNV